MFDVQGLATLIGIGFVGWRYLMLNAKNETKDLPRHVLSCLHFLSVRCDGAKKRDGKGFSKKDARFGRSLARQSRLSPRQVVAGAHLVARYPSQLALGGLRPPSHREILAYKGAQIGRASCRERV